MKWDVDKANSVLWVPSEAAYSLCYTMKKVVGINFTKHLVHIIAHDFKWCTLESENIKIGNFVIKRFHNPKTMQKYVKDYLKFYRNCIAELDRADLKHFRKLTDQQLLKILERSNQLYRRNLDFGFIMEPFDFVTPKLIESMLIKNGYNNHEVSEMTAVPQTSFLNREERDLLSIRSAKRSRWNGLIKKHVWKYRWILSAHLGRKDIPLSSFRKRMVELKNSDVQKRISHLRNFEAGIRKQRSIIQKKKPVDKETLVLLKIIEEISPLHDVRKELFMRTIYTVDSARLEICRRFGYSNNDLAVFEVSEIKSIFFGEKFDLQEAKRRHKECVFYVDTKREIWKYITGKKARNFAKKELAVKLEDQNEIKGGPASSGTATGRVCIIHGTKDMERMKQGNVIVSSMTKPEMMPAIKKAVAIVTDEGGITCHAAIVAREFKIPCVIGTKIASRLLNDGDLIVVDGTNGLVRRRKG